MGEPIYGYGRVSTARQSEDGYGLDAQRAAVTEAAARRGWGPVCWTADTCSGAVDPHERDALGPLLDELDDAGGVLVAAKLDRLARSALAFLELTHRAEEAGWSLVVLDLGLDTGTPLGRFTATILAAVAELERDLIAQRVREGMAAAAAQGVHCGRPPEIDPAVEARIVAERERGATLAEIAERLRAQGVPTARGGRWWPATVGRVLDRHERQEAAA